MADLLHLSLYGLARANHSLVPANDSMARANDSLLPANNSNEQNEKLKHELSAQKCAD
ncbi:hypothetical protein [Alloprevotella tannerae]|uniref:hypothetical protein n=1 Tax=Alloprevotella tannerae TaxID=76122 RepID=UPI0028E4BA28|nr:hypothetical protein [Alloprevotella tannerae]